MRQLAEVSLRNLAKKSKEGIAWLKKQIKSLGKSGKSLGSFAEKGSTQIEPGKMVFFRYDAKHKDTLPYFDMFPLSIIVDIKPDGFTGLNLHYLPPKIRAIFLVRLMDIINNKKMDKSTKFNVSYGILRSASKLKFFAPCYKRYLASHIKSKINVIKPEEWHNAIMLPSAQFSGASKSKVWRDSKGMY